jgi:hypothetical protein
MARLGPVDCREREPGLGDLAKTQALPNSLRPHPEGKQFLLKYFSPNLRWITIILTHRQDTICVEA